MYYFQTNINSLFEKDYSYLKGSTDDLRTETKLLSAL